MSFIGESILTASITVLIERMASTSTELSKFLRQQQVHADLEKWKDILVMIKAVLDDAEGKQGSDQVKMWLAQLQNLAFDVEDILDEFATELLRRKLADGPQASSSRARKQISSYCSSLNPRSFKFNSRIIGQMKEVTTRLQDIATLKDQLGLMSSSGERSDRSGRRPTTTSSMIEAEVYGRKEDQDEIVKLLLSTEGGISVLPITGMGGIGKTTLAKLAYNDARLKGNFDLKAWVCVSEEFDVTRITKEILSYICDGTVNVDYNLSKLQEELKEKLFKKKFLFVLDDIWNENRDDWNSLRYPFEVGSPGSKVIVTTRSQIVSKRMGTLPAFELKKLSFEACFNVFTQHASGQTDFRVHQDLKEIGEKIVKRCGGLPLAAETLGGLLRDEVDRNKWKGVLNTKIWDQEGNNILPALRVSYFYLPSPLKRCFAYCSIFPKGHEFSKEQITLLWMAEGFLHCEDNKKKMENKGYEYFNDLKSRSFFQRSGKDMYVMHDLINDLAQWAAGEMCCRMDGHDKQQNFPRNLRYLSYVRDAFENEKKFEAVYDAKHLRSFLPVGLLAWRGNFLSCSVLHKLSRLRYLRTLSLVEYKITELPNEIGNLEHLRYLDVSYTRIRTLPESISSLYHLETLLLANCDYLKKMCADMGKLVNLLYLNNSNAFSLEQMPRGMGNLTGLLELPNFVVGKGRGSSLKELSPLKHIRGTLRISGLENVRDRDSEKASLNSKRKINALTLEWSGRIEDSREVAKEMDVLNNLRPHQDLKELTIYGYGGTTFPIWIGDSSFSVLKRLELKDFGRCTFLPPVGQLPSLKFLIIKGMAGVKSVGPEFYNGSKPFPSLETLCFEDMQQWEDWVPRGHSEESETFPSLLELSIVKCPKLLGRLPERLPSLERLVIRSCEQFSVSVPSLPKLCSFEIDRCKEMVGRRAISSHHFPTQGLSKLEELKIVGCKELTSLWKSRIELLQDNSFLRRLEIERCPQLLCLMAEEEEGQQQRGLPCGLQYLKLEYCQSLIKLPQVLGNLSLLTEISIVDCPKLNSFPGNDMPPHLRDVEIKRCDALKALPELWMCNNNTSLEWLSIAECHSLKYVCRAQLPPNLKRLQIRSCDNLRTLVDEEGFSVTHEEITSSGQSRNASLLESLEIRYCPSLTSLWSKSELPCKLERIQIISCLNLVCLSGRGNIPKPLKDLKIDNCSNLESIAEGLQDCTYLEEIQVLSCNNLKFSPEDVLNLSHSLVIIVISKCQSLVSFPEAGLPSKNLRKLKILSCEHLRALPNRMHNLTSLESLEIEKCGSMGSLPEDGLPTSLTSLSVHYNEKICKALFNWGLDKITSLTYLSIAGGCPDVVSFPSEKMTLPASLRTLWIGPFPKLERISSQIQNLVSLEQLCLWDCSKLKSFPKKGLPSSLLRLQITSCPMLKQRCEKDRGKYWRMIAGIPWPQHPLTQLLWMRNP